MPSDLTKGSGTALSALIFGNWANLYIGMWGYVDILVDPYTGSKEGNVRVVANADCDIGALRGESFSVIKDMVTSQSRLQSDA